MEAAPPDSNGQFDYNQVTDTNSQSTPVQNSIPPQARTTPPVQNNYNQANNPVPPNQNYNQYNQPPKKKKRTGLKIFLFVVLGLFILMIVGLVALFSPGGMYDEVIDYDDYRDDETLFTIEVNPKSDTTVYEMDIVGLNNGIDSDIDLEDMFDVFDEYGYEIKDMCFDTDDNYMYLLAKGDNGKYIDVTYSYQRSSQVTVWNSPLSV